TSLTGRVQLYRNGLRYQDGKVDRRVDSQDTLAHVIEDYLQRRFATRDVRLEQVPQVVFPITELDLEVEAHIDGKPENLPIRLSKSADRGWAVPGDRFPVLPAPAAAETPVQAQVTAAERPALTRPVDRRLRFS